MDRKDFRAELLKIMPGYNWTVHDGSLNRMEATGAQSSGSNRLSTLRVFRSEEPDGKVSYEVMSAGYGLRAPWLHKSAGKTLAQSLRGLQDHYKAVASTYRSHEQALQSGRFVDRVEEASPCDLYVMKVLKSNHMVAAFMAEVNTNPERKPGEGLEAYLQRCLRADFESGPEECLFPDVYASVTAEPARERQR